MEAQAQVETPEAVALKKAMSEVNESAAKSRPDPVVYDKMEIGDIHWQGDVGIQRVSFDLEEKIWADKIKTDAAGRGILRPGREHLRSWNAKVEDFVTERVEVGSKWVKVEVVAQLAPGNTRGSRHLIHDECLPHVEMYDIARRDDRTIDALRGKVIKTSKALRIVHPEHGAVTVPAGLYMVIFQRAHNNRPLGGPTDQGALAAQEMNREFIRALD
jgi:hypothetical protein